MNKRKIIQSVAAGGLLGLVLASAVAFVKFSVHSRFPEGTSVAGVDISMASKQEARDILSREVENYLKKEVKVSFLNNESTISIKDLGLEFYTEETLEEINTIDSREVSVIDLLNLNSANKKENKLKNRINQNSLENALEEIFPLEELAPKNAEIYIDTAGAPQVIEGEKGLVVDYKKLAEDIMVAGNSLEAVNVELATYRAEPEVKAEDLEKQKDEISRKLSQTITLVDPVYSDDWYISLEDHLDWVSLSHKQKVIIPFINEETFLDIEGDKGELDTEIHLEIIQEKLDEFVEAEISEWLDRPAEDVKIFTDDNGEVVVEGKGSNGREVQRRLLKESIELALESGITEIVIPVIDIEPQILISEDLQALGIKERLAVGHTSYYGSPANRVHNIKVGAEKFNGTIIKPGETFSFNQNLGPVDGSTGYRKELVIKPEGTVPEYGGGICQVSTTFYRAILLSGLPITERHPHSYAVSYYSQVMGHGLDATIYLGGPDLQFTNDTGSHLLVQTYTEGDYELSVVFYGSEYNKTVEMEGPYLSGYYSPGPTIYQETSSLPKGVMDQVERAHTGFNAVWYRHITNEDGTTETETITTKYKAVPAKIMVGTAE